MNSMQRLTLIALILFSLVGMTFAGTSTSKTSKTAKTSTTPKTAAKVSSPQATQSTAANQQLQQFSGSNNNAVQVWVNPASTQVAAGGQQQFNAYVTGSTNVHVTWSVSGAGCMSDCGYISPFGLYTAPSTAPTPNAITITAKLGPSPVVTGTARITIQGGSNSGGGITVSPGSVQLSGGGQQSFFAALNGVATSVTWSLSGSGCTGTACGTISSSGYYLAPSTISSAATVTVTATSVFPAGNSGTATVNLSPSVSVSVNPASVQVNTSSQQQFTATVSNTSNSGVFWTVSCGAISCGAINASGAYTAPATVPSPNSVTVTATSLADFTQKGTATVTIASPGAASVSISPSNNLQLNAGAQQQFSATVTGATNTAVTWSMAGQGCFGAACGAITQGGLYTAPTVAPYFGSINITATSQANSTDSASVAVQVIQLVGITLAPWTPQMTTGTQQQFSAMVTGSTNTTVNWSVAGSGCFTPGSCGTISSSGLYAAPSGVTTPLAFTITATAQADPSKTASATITVAPLVVVTVSPTPVTASINSQQQYSATVTGALNTVVQWGVSGPGCSGAACGAIVSSNGNSAFYQAPPVAPAPATVNVTATLISDNTKSGSAAVTIVSTNNSGLNGHYAFLFTGFDGTVSYQAAGTLIADGNGNITNGIEDINCGPGAQDVICGSAPITSMMFSGTYTLNADNRGTLTIKSSLGTSTFTIALGSTTGDVRFIEADGSTIRGSGVLKPQTQTDFSNDAFDSSGYALGLVGVDSSGGRIGMIGAMVLPSGMIESATLRINDRVLHCVPGVICQDTTYLLPASGQGLTGTFNVDPNSGRGVLTINAPGFSSGTLNFGMYVVSRNEFFLVSNDPLSTNPVLSGDVLQQQLPQSIVFFQPGNSVISWSALTGGLADVALGTIGFGGNTGNGAVKVSQLVFDENNAGVVNLDNIPCVSCSLAPLGNNEMLLPVASLGSSFHLYPFGLNSAFLLGNTSSVQFGKIESQTQVIPNSFAFGSDSMLDPNAPLVLGTASINLPQVSGNEDLSQTSGFTGNLALNGTWPSNLSGGTGTISLTLPGQQSIAYWIVSYEKIIGLDIDSSAVTPNLLIFEQ